MNKLDLKILKALAAAGPPYELSTFELQKATSRFYDRKWLSLLDTKIISVYRAGERLDQAGLIEWFPAPGGPERGGRDRRMFRATDAGLIASLEREPEGIWDRYFVPGFIKRMDEGNGGTTYRVKFNRRSSARLEALQKKTEAESPKEVFQNALALYDACIDWDDGGNRFAVITPLGDVVPVDVFYRSHPIDPNALSTGNRYKPKGPPDAVA